MDILIYIKRLAIEGRLDFTLKATLEMDADNLTKRDVVEALVTASRISKVLKSRSRFRENRVEKLYIIKGKTFSGVPVYTKGTCRRVQESEVFYVLISSKRAL